MVDKEISQLIARLKEHPQILARLNEIFYILTEDIVGKGLIEKGRQMERVEWIKAAMKVGGMIASPRDLIIWIQVIEGEANG